MCNFNGKSSFSLTQRAVTLGPIFTKMVLNRLQGSKEKSQEVSVQKMSTSGDITKNVGGGPILPPLPPAE